MSCFSINLTTGELKPLTDVEVSFYSAPMFITGVLVCMEVVFWSPPWGRWICLVRDKTERLFPPNGNVVEIAADQLPWYEEQLKKRG